MALRLNLLELKADRVHEVFTIGHLANVSKGKEKMAHEIKG